MEAARDQKHIRGQKHLEEVEHKLKSVNLQYNTLGCLDKRTSDQASDVPSIIFFIIS